MNSAEYLQSRLREHRAKSERAEWLAAYGRATESKVADEAILPSARAREIHALFFERLKSGKDIDLRDLPIDQRPHMVAAILSRVPPLPEKRGWLLFGHVDFPGALRVNLEALLLKSESLWGLLLEDICFASLDGHSGLCLEKNFQDSLGNYAKEGYCTVSTWGDFRVLLS